MWIMTPFGFFSIVAKPSDRAAGTVTIRARDAADLERLRAHVPGLGPTVTGAGTDYPARAVASRAELGQFLARFVETGLDYQNFKSEVARQQGPVRAKVYGRVWDALLEIERNAQYG